MAAATVATGYPKRDRVVGDFKLVPVKFTSLANTNTYTGPTGWQIMGFILLTCTTSAAITATAAANVLTFNVSAGTPDVVGFIVVAV